MRLIILLLSITIILIMSSPYIYADTYIVPSHEFKVENGYTTTFHRSYASAYNYGSHAPLIASVRLPVGSWVNGLTCQVYDASPDFRVRVELLEVSHSDYEIMAGAQIMVSVSSSKPGSTGPVKLSNNSLSTNEIKGIVKYQFEDDYHSYMLRYSPDGYTEGGGKCENDCRIYNCSIDYTPPRAGR